MHIKIIQEGAGYLAGLAAGYPVLDRFTDYWRPDHRFEPAIDAETRSRKLAGWHRAVKRL